MSRNGSGSKCKRWCFTSFDMDNEPVFNAEVHEYLIYGRETCPDTARRHLQGFVTFKNRTTLAGCKRWIAGAHFERARGTPEEASVYCKKDGDFAEFGKLPTVTGRPDKFRDLLDKAERGEISSIKDTYPGLYIRYKANILSSIQFDIQELDNSCGVWICGPPRTSKDYGVRKLGDVYQKPLSKWWDGYRNQRYVLLSDVEPSHGSWLGYFLKVWSDCYPFNAEIKGGSMLIRPKKIFVTSNFTMDRVFSGEILEALLARFNVYDLFPAEPVVKKRISACPSDRVFNLLLEHEENVTQEISTEVPAAPPQEVLSETADQQSEERASTSAEQC